jgi:hypothetical protein
MKIASFVVPILALALAGSAIAGRLANESTPAVAGKPQAAAAVTAPVAATPAADDSSSLREGVITAVSDKRDQIEVNGSWLKVVAGSTRVFRQGRSVNAGDELVKGSKVKFTLAPGAADRATLGVVYVP